MGYFEDIGTQLGVGSYSTQSQDTGLVLNVDFVSGPVAAWSDITSLLTLPADFEDLNIALVDGQTCSLYGFDAENTVVMLNDDGSQKWCHCTRYANGSDYTSGKTILTPPVGLRV